MVGEEIPNHFLSIILVISFMSLADPKADEYELVFAGSCNHLVCEEAVSVADESGDLDSTKVTSVIRITRA